MPEPLEPLVAPQVYELAEVFVFDLLKGLNRPLTPSQREPIVRRLAAAMQRAVEDEYDAVRQELADA